MAVWIAVGVLAVVLLWTLLSYNRLVRLRNEADEGFSAIDVQLKRRADLVPNLVETVKGYAAHEQEAFRRVTEARARTLQASSVDEMAQADEAMEQAVGRLMALAEDYPDLKAVEVFRDLQEELADTEDKIAAARRYYNTVVRRLNIAIESVPTNLVAAAAGFRTRQFYRLQAEREREPVGVRL